MTCPGFARRSENMVPVYRPVKRPYMYLKIKTDPIVEIVESRDRN